MNRICKPESDAQPPMVRMPETGGAPADSNVGMVGRTDATQAAYLKRGWQLWRRIAQRYQLRVSELPCDAFLSRLEKLLPTLLPSSRRQYIASVRALLVSIRSNPSRSLPIVTDDDLERAMAMHSWHYSQPGEKWPKRGRTSSRKAKHLNIVQLASNTDQLDLKDHMWLRPAILWLTANTIVGLRPVEWRTVAMEKVAGIPYLLVRNAKHTNGRSFGCGRRLDLSGLRPVELRLVQRQVEAAHEHAHDDASWDRYYNGVRREIHRMARVLLPGNNRYPTLYSSRHQFAANAKSAGMSKPEIAATMGHATDETATMHYGTRKNGTGVCGVKPDPLDVQKVRVRTDSEDPFRSMFADLHVG